MLGTLILGIAAGWCTPFAEPRIKAALENVLLADVPINATEMRLLSFAVCLVGAAVLAMIFAHPHAAPLAIGGVLGVLGPKLVDKWKASKTPDYDS